MNYRELLELTRKHPNPFSINHRKTRMYDFELKNKHQETTEEPKESIKKTENIEQQDSRKRQKSSYYNTSYRGAIKACKRDYY